METIWKVMFGIMTLMLLVVATNAELTKEAIGDFLGTAKPKVISVTIDENLKTVAEDSSGKTYDEALIIEQRYKADIIQKVNDDFTQSIRKICSGASWDTCVDRKQQVTDLIVSFNPEIKVNGTI
jgi:long-subunit acyl-CoA synthetase (AMP-forming)